MRSRGNLTARVNKTDTCQDLRAFALDLQRMKETNRFVPFSGMTIALGGLKWNHGDWCKKSPAGELDQVYQDILDQMTWKHLAVSFNGNWNKCKSCPAFLLVDKILQKYTCTLEELSIHVEKKRKYVQHILSDCCFSNLKTLRILKENSPGRPGACRYDNSIFIKTLVSKAPNLQVLYTEDLLDLRVNLLEGTSAVHVTDYEYASGLDKIPQDVVSKLRIQRIKLVSGLWGISVDRFNRTISTLLQNSRNELSSMEIAATILVPLTHYRICLPKVRSLHVRFTVFGSEVDQPRLWRLVKSFDFKRIFPNLSTVHISWMQHPDFKSLFDAFKDMIEQENATYREPMPDRAVNIKTLSLQWVGGILDSSTEFLVQMFPDIKKLSIRADEMRSTRIWESRWDLKELSRY